MTTLVNWYPAANPLDLRRPNIEGFYILNKFPECSTKINLISNLPFLVVEPRAILHSCRKDIDETIAAVRNHYSLLSTSVAVLDWWNRWYDIYGDSLPPTTNNNEENNNNSNSGWDLLYQKCV